MLRIRWWDVSGIYYHSHPCGTPENNSARLSILLWQFEIGWTDFRVIWCRVVLLKFVSTLQLWSKTDSNNGYFSWRPTRVSVLRSDWELPRHSQISKASLWRTHHNYYAMDTFPNLLLLLATTSYTVTVLLLLNSCCSFVKVPHNEYMQQEWT